MSDNFLGEIKLLPYAWPPKGWALCDGSLLPINQNQALFSLLGTTYGGNGVTTFALPDLRGRTALHANPSGGEVLGQAAGAETVTITNSTMPTHNHMVAATTTLANNAAFDGNLIAATNNTMGDANLYGQAAALVALASGSVTTSGGSQPHNNCQPSLVMNFCIATSGIFPTRN